MSEAVETEQPKKRRGRPPGTGKKRHDPADAPVDGDYRLDALLNQEPGKRYAFLDKEDALKFKRRGYRKVERSENGVQPAMGDEPEDAGSGYQVRGLTLFECDEEKAQKYDDYARSQSEGRMQAIHAAAQRTGGYMTKTAE